MVFQHSSDRLPRLRAETREAAAIDGAGWAAIVAPHGRDAAVAKALLAEAGIEARIQPSFSALVAMLDDTTCFVVMTIEAVRGAHLRLLTEALSAQQPWSDLPIILLTQRGGGPERNPEAARLSEALGNVTFLEKPFHPTTFVSVARAALKSRQRQLEARARIEQIQEGEANLRTALIAGRLGTWELDVASGALTTSPACKALFGRGPTQPFSYQDLVSTVHPDDRSRMIAEVERTLATGADYGIEYRVTPPDQCVRWADIRARVVGNRPGRPMKLVGVSSDITDRKASELALLSVNELLEMRVAERTAQLELAHASRLAEVEQRERAEALLHQAQKMEMIGQFTGGVAHDFNNLLMAVLASLDLLRKFIPDDPKAVRLLAGAAEGAKRGATLTQRLLAFARRQELEVKPRDLVSLVREMEDLLARSAGAQVRLIYDLDAGTPHASVDANQVELVLLNLVINARDAMPSGGEVTVSVDCVDETGSDGLAAGGYVRLCVRDQGVGMDAGTLAKATEPFFSTKAVGKGTGLGLSMAHGLAVQLGGALRLTSAVDVGTRAEILFPVAKEAEEGWNEPSPSPPETPQTVSLHVLVVDDDPLIAMSTVDMLEDLGHTVVECSSGAEALGHLQRGARLDLMITDFAMPGMTGVQLARAARDIRHDLPILLASGFAEFPEADSIDLPRLAKPYMQGELREAIRRTLSMAVPVLG